MKLGRVIGRVVCTQKMERFEGLKLLLVQPVDENSKEAAKANPNGWFNPGDAAILGVVDGVNVAGDRT